MLYRIMLLNIKYINAESHTKVHFGLSFKKVSKFSNTYFLMFILCILLLMFGALRDCQKTNPLR